MPLTHFNDAVPCKAFADVSAGIDGWSNEEAEIYQTAASTIRHFLDCNSVSEHRALIAETEKSYFYEMFVRNKPVWAGAVVFVDDADKNINSVTGMHNQLAPEHKLLTLLNRNERREVKNTMNFNKQLSSHS
ncbi:hypothetical protein Lbir_1074 [Legionella birminghamensis]|uniref:Uncharacterized protein n=1 Tax=Legionella birminghamensis TaxID=28083 RepID=A0A378I7H2_9GAMM|nr:hypothetical protein [Legionella birminghamensis]KTC73812.1 hypothetical protein Lbir_1074 [Legionella birminghamensis]STX30690.1 Uncharacterised protein [Legionella birminghamensis]